MGGRAVEADEFWLSDRPSPAILPHLPKSQPRTRRLDDRSVISGIIHVLKSGWRWWDGPTGDGPRKTIDHRWSPRRV